MRVLDIEFANEISSVVKKYTTLISKVSECGRNAPFIRKEESDQANDLVDEIIRFCGMDLHDLKFSNKGNQAIIYFSDSMANTLGKMTNQLQDFNKAYARRKEALNAAF